MHQTVEILPEVQDALESRTGVVALETTILSHGMPYPQNIETARQLEAIVRERGAVPATIAVLGGTIRIGLHAHELERFAQAGNVLKLSRADLAYALAAKADGATTVAATMICAHLAGIRIFATGGIGGVHRGAERSMDVSADLDELARTPVVVVCAGAKALLDLPKTLEALETRGVPVIGFGTAEFPAFWSASSGLALQMRFDRPADLARYLRTQQELDLGGGALIVTPVPAQDEIPAPVMEEAIDRAVRDAEEEGITGKAVTPWLLQRIFELTAGRSLEANIALVKNNARLAADVARFLGR